jgi:uncharacterized membrane protein YhaH (DUF805 family)
MSTPTPAPGWYPDPSQHGTQRYWDGAAWTASTQPTPGALPAPAAPGYAPAAPAYAGPGHAAAPQVGFVEAIKLGFAKYGTFAGRATRAEYWWWYLFTMVLFVPLYLIALIMTAVSVESGSGQSSSAGSGVSLVLFLVLFVVALALLVPTISVLVRRLHDTDRSGWWYWISVVPFVGGIILIVLLVLESTPGPNQYGPPSRGAADL